jgi:hypothetical protein
MVDEIYYTLGLGVVHLRYYEHEVLVDIGIDRYACVDTPCNNAVPSDVLNFVLVL